MKLDENTVDDNKSQKQGSIRRADASLSTANLLVKENVVNNNPNCDKEANTPNVTIVGRLKGPSTAVENEPRSKAKAIAKKTEKSLTPQSAKLNKDIFNKTLHALEKAI